MGEEWTAEQIEEAIPGAIGDANWPAVEGLLLMLALRAPHRAELMYQTMKVGLASRREEAV